MRDFRFGAALALVTLLCGCGKMADGASGGGGHHGRYQGIGVYSTGQLWSQLADADRAKDPAAAGTDDDEHIIVVVDRQTGELRECGDYSGYCVSMNPWTKAIGPAQTLPAKLVKHADELAKAADREAVAADAKK